MSRVPSESLRSSPGARRAVYLVGWRVPQGTRAVWRSTEPRGTNRAYLTMCAGRGEDALLEGAYGVWIRHRESSLGAQRCAALTIGPGNSGWLSLGALVCRLSGAQPGAIRPSGCPRPMFRQVAMSSGRRVGWKSANLQVAKGAVRAGRWGAATPPGLSLPFDENAGQRGECAGRPNIGVGHPLGNPLDMALSLSALGATERTCPCPALSGPARVPAAL